MHIGLLAFLGAFAGFYLGLAVYLLVRNLIRLRRPIGTPNDVKDGRHGSLESLGEGDAHL